jgi:hypothetical protein
MTKHKNTHYLYIVSINYVVSSNPAHSEGYPIQHCVIKFVGDLRRSMVYQGTPVCFTNKTDRHDIVEILLKVVLSTISRTLILYGNHECRLLMAKHFGRDNTVETPDLTEGTVVFVLHVFVHHIR